MLKNNQTQDKIAGALDVARQIAETSLAEAAGVDSTNAFPQQTFQLIAANNLLNVALPAKFGGHGLGIETGKTLPQLELLQIIGRGNLAVGRVYEGHLNALQLISWYASEQQLNRYAADVCEHKKIFGVWNTEASDGVKMFPLENDRYRLEGSKTFASGAGFVERPFVNCALPDDGGWQMCIVPMEKVRTKVDQSWWQPIGMRSTRSFKIDFTDVILTAQDLIGAPGDYYRQPFFSGGAIRFAAVHLGGAEALFDQTRQFLRESGRTIDPYQRARLGEMAIRIESGNLWLRGAAEMMDKFLDANSSDDAESTEKLLAYVNMTRTAIEQICQDVMLLCERSIGARGLMQNYHFERIIRDLTIYLRQPAPDAALNDVGRFVLENTTENNGLWRPHG